MPVKTLTLGGANGELESKMGDEEHPGNYTHLGSGVLDMCVYCWFILKAARGEGMDEMRSIFGVRTDILIARSILPNQKIPITQDISYPTLFHLRNGCLRPYLNCSSVVGLTKYAHVPISVVSTG